MSDFRFIGHTPQDDLPDEQWMKHFIEHYRWLLDQNERLAAYAKKLEKRISDLTLKCSEQGATNKKLSEKYVLKNRENKRLRAHIEWLNEKLKEQEGGEE